MPNTREKLIELLQCSPTDIMGNRGVGALADHLIANGVTIPVRCKDCKFWREEIMRDGEMKCCSIGLYMTKGDSFCSFGKKAE